MLRVGDPTDAVTLAVQFAKLLYAREGRGVRGSLDKLQIWEIDTAQGPEYKSIPRHDYAARPA
jgi:hypothetical protein